MIAITTNTSINVKPFLARIIITPRQATALFSPGNTIGAIYTLFKQDLFFCQLKKLILSEFSISSTLVKLRACSFYLSFNGLLEN